jgi:hypothetical protein
MVCYDLDVFRREVVENDLLKGGPADNIDKMAVAEMDDTCLLRIGLKWLHHALINEK